MKIRWRSAWLLAGALLAATDGRAQQQPTAANPPEAVPEKMPFNTPYGAPVSLTQAQSAIQAAIEEANKRGWPINVAVLDSGANLVAFARMDGAQIGSIAVAQHKARTAVKFRRPTRFFEERIAKANANNLLSIDDVIASAGGIPLVAQGKLIGAIGCSGATSAQDEIVCQAGAAAIGK